MKYIVGAYVGSPALDRWDAEEEAAYYDGLSAISAIRGLEHPFYGPIHRDDDAWFLAHVAPEWDYVFTCIPGTMDRLRSNPQFGLASIDRKGRREAIDFHARASDAVAAVNAHLGRPAVIAVQVHSAPRQRAAGEGTGEAFRDSLEELASLDWHGAALVVEHCDAYNRVREPEKGFLNLQEEIQAIRTAGSPVGVTVNWARSAIEGRSVDTPVEHVRLLREHGLLAGVMFSGVAATVGAYGAWKDTHAPPAGSGTAESVLPRDSLMTAREIRRCLDAAGSLQYVGAKVRLLPRTASLEHRFAVIRETLAMLESALPGWSGRA